MDGWIEGWIHPNKSEVEKERESERTRKRERERSKRISLLPRSRPGFGWLRLAARQRSVRKFSADKLARIVRIILQGLPVLTAAGGLSWHNLSLPRPPSPPLSLFLFLPRAVLFLLLLLLFLYLSFLTVFISLLFDSFSPGQYVSIGFGSRDRRNVSRPDPRGNREGEAGRMRVPKNIGI